MEIEAFSPTLPDRPAILRVFGQMTESQGWISSGISGQIFMEMGTWHGIGQGHLGSEHGRTLFLVERNVLDDGCLLRSMKSHHLLNSVQPSPVFDHL